MSNQVLAKRLLILFVLSIFLVGVGYYLLQILNPFTEEAISQLIRSQQVRTSTEFIELLKELTSKGLVMDYLNIRNVLIVIGVWGAAVLSGFVAVHLLLDRLFVAKFYQQPSLVNAIRRGVLVVLGMGGVIAARLYSLDWYVVLMWIVLLLIVELVVWKLLQKSPAEEVAASENMTLFAHFAYRMRTNGAKLKGKMNWQGVKGLFVRQIADQEGED